MLNKIIDQLRDNDIVYLKAKIIPKSSENKIVEVMDDGTYKIRIKAAPERGRANKELIKFLRKEMGGVNVTIISGKTDRVKLIKISK